MQQLIQKIKGKETLARLKIQTAALKAMHDYMTAQGVTQLLPVMLSPVTDPLCHDVSDASIIHDGQELQLTKSMLLHKQVAFLAEELEKLYIVSPCVRLETKACKDSGRHLIEFSQLDIELKGATRREFMHFMESLIVSVLETVKQKCAAELEQLGSAIVIPSTPFKVYESKDLEREHGPDYETIVSLASTELFWIFDLKREFYDREDPVKPGYYRNYDLVWPGGFGEALSGGERDYEYEVLLRKLAARGQTEEDFAPYMALAKEGLLVPTAGGGLGIERLVRFLSKTQHIKDAVLFPRTPGEKVLL